MHDKLSPYVYFGTKLLMVDFNLFMRHESVIQLTSGRQTADRLHAAPQPNEIVCTFITDLHIILLTEHVLAFVGGCILRY